MKIKTNIHSIFQTDNKLEEQGAWVEVNNYTGLAIKVRRLSADVVTKGYEKIIKETFGDGKLRSKSDLTEEQAQNIQIKHLANYVLIDWKNLVDEDTSEEIPYSVDAAISLLEIKDFREYVFQAAKERDAFKTIDTAESEKN